MKFSTTDEFIYGLILTSKSEITNHNSEADEPEVLFSARLLTKSGPSRKFVAGQTVVDTMYHIHTKEQQQVEAIAVV